MTFTQAIQSAFEKYATFRGRAIRSEFWFFALFCFIGSLIAQLIDSGNVFGNIGIFEALFSLATIVPSLAVGARRLHDTGRTGWWQLLGLIPIIGWIILIIWFASRGEEAPNQYGKPPAHGASDASTHESNIPSVRRDD